MDILVTRIILIVHDLEWKILNKVSNLSLSSPKLSASANMSNANDDMRYLPNLTPPRTAISMHQMQDLPMLLKHSNPKRSKFQVPQPHFAFPDVLENNARKLKRSKQSSPVSVSNVLAAAVAPYENRLDSLLSTMKAKRGYLLKAKRHDSVIPVVNNHVNQDIGRSSPIIPMELLLPNVDDDLSSASVSPHEYSLVSSNNNQEGGSSLLSSSINAMPSFHIGTSKTSSEYRKSLPLPRFLPKQRNRNRYRIRSLLRSSASVTPPRLSDFPVDVDIPLVGAKQFKEGNVDDENPFLSLECSLL